MASNIRINLPIQEPKERFKDYKLRDETEALGNVPALLSTLGSDCFAFSRRGESLALATLGPRGPREDPARGEHHPPPPSASATQHLGLRAAAYSRAALRREGRRTVAPVCGV